MTQKQQQILDLIKQGVKKNRQIAERLGINPSTSYQHLESLRKLGLIRKEGKKKGMIVEINEMVIPTKEPSRFCGVRKKPQRKEVTCLKCDRRFMGSMFNRLCEACKREISTTLVGALDEVPFFPTRKMPRPGC